MIDEQKNEKIYSLVFTSNDIRGHAKVDDDGNETYPFADFTDEQCRLVGRLMDKSMGWAETVWECMWQILEECATEVSQDSEANTES